MLALKDKIYFHWGKYEDPESGQEQTVDVATTAIRDQWTRTCFGNFECTDATRPMPNIGIVPQEGWRFDEHSIRLDDETEEHFLLMTAIVTRRKLFDVLKALINDRSVGKWANLILENETAGYSFPSDPVPTQYLCDVLRDYLPLIIHDGALDVAVQGTAEASPTIILDDHKILRINEPSDSMRRTLELFGLENKPFMYAIDEGRHMHKTAPHFQTVAEECVNALNEY
jgi:hypothetical protein